MEETEEYGISSTVFRAGRPFHPGRLWDSVSGELDSGAYGDVLRPKGFFWLASRPRVSGEVGRARRNPEGFTAGVCRPPRAGR